MLAPEMILSVWLILCPFTWIRRGGGAALANTRKEKTKKRGQLTACVWVITPVLCVAVRVSDPSRHSIPHATTRWISYTCLCIRLHVLGSSTGLWWTGSDQSGDRRGGKESANEMKAETDRREEMEKQSERKGLREEILGLRREKKWKMDWEGEREAVLVCVYVCVCVCLF